MHAGRKLQLILTSNIKIGKNVLSDLDHGMVFGVRQVSLSVSETAGLLLKSWDFHIQQSLKFMQSGVKNKEASVA